MADVSTTTPIGIRRLKLPRLRFPLLAIATSINAMPRLIGDALKMAYVDPYASFGRKPPNNLEGRDPDW